MALDINPIAAFIQDACILAPTRKVRVASAYRTFSAWARFKQLGRLPGPKEFSNLMAQRFERKASHEPETHKTFWYFLGVDLKAQVKA